jgi:hypothetical protein
MGPVITAIDEGHFQKSDTHGHLVCREDGETMPCSRLRAAQKKQKDYATTLRHQIAAALGRGGDSTFGRLGRL